MALILLPQGNRDRFGYLLARLPHRILSQMRVALGRRRLLMTE